jgi:uncharacterized membrane protein
MTSRQRRSASPPDGNRADAADSNVRQVADLERAATMHRSVAARVCDRITHDAGTTASIVGHALVLSAWIAWNCGLFGLAPFDPFPFSLLTSVLSIEAIVLTLFVLASQNRMTHEADKRASLDLQVNLLAEQEMTLALRMLRDLCEHFHLHGTTESKKLSEAISDTNIKDLAERVDRSIAKESGDQVPPTRR